jgi:PAS domain S-box-containing protein
VTQEQRRQAFLYLLPVLTTAVAVVVTRTTQPYLPLVLLPFFILAVAIAALYGGTGPGAVALILSLAALRTWFLPPGDLSVSGRARLVTFLTVSLPIVWLAGSVHAQRSRLAQQARENERLRRLAEEEASRAAEFLARRREADDALQRSGAELADFFETASIGLHWVDADGTILRVNRAELELLGYESDEYVGRNIAEFHADQPVIADILRRLLAGERIQQYPARLRRKDGGITHVVIDSSGYFQDGRFVHSRCFTRDVTAEKQAHDAVVRLAAIISSSTDAIIGKTLDGIITSWNQAAERIFGYTEAEMVGQSIYKLIPVELHDVERGVLDRLRRGEAVELDESERIRKDGRRIWISLSVSPIRDDTGIVTGAASIKRDVTEHKLLQEHLRDTQRLQAVGQLAGGMAHEANNQMSVVLGGAHFLLRRADLPDDARQDIEHIRQAAERTALITQQLLAFGRRQLLQPREVDLNAVVQAMGPVLRRSLREDQELVIRLGTLGARILADPRQTEQVLLNLTLNAREAMAEAGRLTIETREVSLTAADAEGGAPPPGTYVVLVVADTGSGMDQATLERAFEPFFTTKEVGQGTGLGLSVVHGTVSQSGGHIRVDSEPGRGTAFRLYFPAVPPRVAGDTPALEPPSAPAAGALVLLVEDEALVRGMAARTLAEAGYAVLEAENGRAALDLMRRQGRPPSLVLTDVGMPEMDGYELTRRLRAEHPGVPVVFLTGYGDRDYRERPTPDSVRAVLRKPLSPEALVHAVGEVLARQDL